MVARYYVQVSTELLDAPDARWQEAGLRLIEVGGLIEPDWRWCLFEDDNAPENLNGLKIELTFGRIGMRPVITGRRVIGAMPDRPVRMLWAAS